MAFSGITVLVRLGIVGALLLSGCSLLPSVASAPTFQADALVSADTWSFTDLTLRPSVQQALYAREVMDVFTDSMADAGTDLHRLPTPSGRTVDFEKDVLPHLDGEVVIAVSGSTDEPQYTLLIHTNDVDGTLRLLAEEATPKLTRDARGATHYQPGDGSDVIAAGYKNWVIYTNSAAMRDQTLDRIDGKGSPSLATKPRYRSVVDRLAGDRLGYGYVDISPLLDQVSVEELILVDTIKAHGRMAYSFGFEGGPEADLRTVGIRIEYQPDVPMVSADLAAGDALQAMDRLPRGSMLAFAGANLGMYSDAFAALNEDDQLQVEVESLLGKFSGPYAFGVASPTRPSDESAGDAVSTFIGGVFFLARLAPDVDADQIAADLTAVADAAAADVDESDSWQHEVIVADDWLAFNAVPAPRTLDQLPQDLLASDRMYQWIRPGLVQDGTNSYVNVEALLAAFAGEFSTDDFAAVSPIRAIGAASQTEVQGDSHTHVQVVIATR